MDPGHHMTSHYMGHGFCLNWEPALVALHVGSDLITGLSYYSIPLAMFYFAFRRRDLPFFKIFIMFALFILSCGTTHLFSAYTIFRPDYWAEGYVKAATAIISALTAVMFIPRLPEAIALPSIIDSLTKIQDLNSELKTKNTELQMANFSIENVLVPVYWISEDARFLRVNGAACDTLGYTEEELLRMTVADVDPHFPWDRWPGHWEEMKSRKSMTIESQHRTKSGHLIDVEVSSNYIAFEGQEFHCALVRDVTMRKRAEKELVANENRMAALYRISQYPFTDEREFLHHALAEVLVFSESATGAISRYDAARRKFTLVSRAGDLSGDGSEGDPGGVWKLEEAELWDEAVRQGKPIFVNDLQARQASIEAGPGDPPGLIRALAVPVVVDDATVAVLGVANKADDYTDADLIQLKQFVDSLWMIAMRKRAECDRLALEKQLLHAQKLESLGVLAGGIAHDFNNILLAIVGNADLALMKLSPESPVIENLQSIEKAAARASDLARQMLAYSGKGKFVVETVDLNRLLHEMLHLLKVSISKKAVLRFNPAGSLPALEVDATQIRQVVMNLVINASEAIGDRSGVIAINTGYMECDRSYLKNIWMDESVSEGSYVYLEISDTGCGMDSDTIAKIFDPFFTTKFTGRGLGMAAVLGIIRGHKGSIRVYSEVGKGTTFKILLPASARLQETSSPAPRVGSWRSSGQVLLVDDEETVQATVGKMLRELGFEVLSAYDGREAVNLFRSHQSIRFVILDLTMPHLDGEQCFRELRLLDSGVKVIMSSGYNEQEVSQRFVGKGLAGFIQKPYKISDLKRAIIGLGIEESVPA